MKNLKNSTCKSLKKHFLNKSIKFSKNSRKAYNKLKLSHKKAVKGLIKTRKLINSVCEKNMSDPNCVELVTMYNDESNIKKALDNMLPGTRKVFTGSRKRISRSKVLTKKICHKH